MWAGPLDSLCVSAVGLHGWGDVGMLGCLDVRLKNMGYAVVNRTEPQNSDLNLFPFFDYRSILSACQPTEGNVSRRVQTARCVCGSDRWCCISIPSLWLVATTVRGKVRQYPGKPLIDEAANSEKPEAFLLIFFLFSLFFFSLHKVFSANKLNAATAGRWVGESQ